MYTGHCTYVTLTSDGETCPEGECGQTTHSTQLLQTIITDLQQEKVNGLAIGKVEPSKVTDG